MAGSHRRHQVRAIGHFDRSRHYVAHVRHRVASRLFARAHEDFHIGPAHRHVVDLDERRHLGLNHQASDARALLVTQPACLFQSLRRGAARRSQQLVELSDRLDRPIEAGADPADVEQPGRLARFHLDPPVLDQRSGKVVLIVKRVGQSQSRDQGRWQVVHNIRLGSQGQWHSREEPTAGQGNKCGAHGFLPKQNVLVSDEIPFGWSERA